MNIIRNIIRGPITSITGLIIICLTSYACIFKDMNWIWEGIAGCGVGTFFLALSDKEMKEYIKMTIDFVLKKFVG